jgi:hypothetical protein
MKKQCAGKEEGMRSRNRREEKRREEKRRVQIP